MQPESRMDMARRVFGRFRVAFPALRFEEVPSEHVDLNVNVPQQDGLAFDVNLNLQGDELHLSVGDGFWLEWFPCGDPAVEASYVEAVAGLLSGEFRIIELRQNGVPVWARLERQVAGRWKRVAAWSRLYFPLPWGCTTRVLQNLRGIAA